MKKDTGSTLAYARAWRSDAIVEEELADRRAAKVFDDDGRLAAHLGCVAEANRALIAYIDSRCED